ncbi:MULTISPECIES: sugar ABC transporter substrate-binding protein [unclassified Devosia]|jgi:multiple sugar transport system substrate-binding protein|uniref:ABC transporter substrate-binding protein n=1 Tax=unclassified Devosia TaxID=196773 RepID=UPI00086E33E9|nr:MULTISPECIES: sugar ABC transporter substrate-binding protein [unclassified Devosia]MBN9363565.1 sugar ABC transporter substrate-binding protein [Devosia sp.]ODS81523.1 MAG: sugar ABC transporter substrate-binding protein [Devosia sp. SCN 66-27]OJX25373.1 MAG: sugar ABC transporter substrate-binding protein [Devosia sp. 66-14]
MLKLSRRSLLLSSAALAAGAGLGVGRAFAQSDATATLKLQGFGGEAQLASINNAIKRFNAKYPNVTVEVEMDAISTGWGDYVTKVLGQFNAGAAADVYGTAIETFQAFSSRGLWLGLNDFVAANTGFSDFAPSLFEQGSYKGEINYVPIGWNNIMINYNRDLFDKAGIAYPANGAWTWEEFREVAKKLTVKDGSGNVTQFGYEVPNQNFFIQPWFFSNGTGVLNDDWTASNMLDPKVAESLQFLYDLIHVDGVSPIPGKDTMDNQFFAGQVAMISRGHWIVENAKANKLNMDIAKVPSKESDTTVIGFGGYAVNKTTANADLAKALILELTSEETQKEEGEGGGGVPGRKSAASTEAFLSFPPSAALYYETLPHTKAVPSPANFQEVEKIFIRYYTAMMSGETSIADGVKQADAELNDSFARLKQQMGG